MKTLMPYEGMDIFFELFFQRDNTNRGTTLSLMLFNNSFVNEETTYSDLVEVSGTGYSRIPLVEANWVLNGNKVTYPTQTFTASGTWTAINGWAVVTDTNKIVYMSAVWKPETILNDTEFYFVDIEIFKSVDSYVDEEYEAILKPSDWQNLPEPLPDEEVIYILMGVADIDNNYALLSFSGDYTIDWGDGVIENYASAVYASHLYDYNSGFLSSETNEGLKQAIIKVTPQSGQTLFGATFATQLTDFIGSGHYSMFLEVKIACSQFQLASNTFQDNPHIRIIDFVYPLNDDGNYFSRAFEDMKSLTWIRRMDIQGLDFISSKNGSYMFANCNSLVKLPFLDLTKFSNLQGAFRYCNSLREINIETSDSLTYCPNMFENCTSLKKVPYVETENCNTLNNFCQSCYNIETFPKLNTSNITNFSYFLDSCYSLKKVSALDYSKATNMAYAFKTCLSLTEIGRNNTLEFLQPVSLRATFSTCSSLEDLSLSIEELSTDSYHLYETFYNCNSLTSLQFLKNLKSQGSINLQRTFSYCNNLKTLELPFEEGQSIALVEGQTFISCFNLNRIIVTGNYTLAGAYSTPDSAFNGTECLRVLENFKLDTLISSSFTNSGILRFKNCSFQSDTNLTTLPRMKAPEIIEVFESLIDRSATTSANINITGMAGTPELTQQDLDIALNKNWTVTTGL